MDGIPVFSLISDTDYIECDYSGQPNLKMLMNDPMIMHAYEWWLAIGGKLAEIIMDPPMSKESPK